MEDGNNDDRKGSKESRPDVPLRASRDVISQVRQRAVMVWIERASLRRKRGRDLAGK